MRKLGAMIGTTGLVIAVVAWAASSAAQPQQDTWLHFVDGSGFMPSVVFSCSERGASSLVVVRYEEGEAMRDSATTPWGSGERILLENHTKPCDCTPVEGGSCRTTS
jgi:hypothetical protein